MLNAVKRGPASISRSIFTLPLHIRTTTTSLSFLSPLSRSSRLSISLTRSLHASTQWRRNATATAHEEDMEDVDEDEAYQEAQNSARPYETTSRNNPSTTQSTLTKFQDLADQKLVCKTVIDTITKDMKLETMTEVQSMTIKETLKGIDVLAQARTGTGKTLAFLIPVLQNIISHDPRLETRKTRTSAPDIRALIISPTRELAEQIAVEARKVARNTGVIVQTAVGGSAKAFGLRRIMTQGCHVLVGTPGRLNDILSDRFSQIETPNLSALVLDEADRLLDQGFAPDIQAIQNLLPRRDRQTLLFSATVPNEVMQIVNQTMKHDFQFVRTVKPGEQQTHEKVPQKIVQIAGFENFMPVLFELCKRELARSDVEMPFKAIVYFNATAEVSLAFSVFQNLTSSMGASYDASRTAQSPLRSALILGMHARLSQAERTRTADAFRRAKSSIMFSSDVTARGMDFPNVTHVIQMGLPPNRDTYIHRIGRTARGDKKGEGYLFITPLEIRESRDRLEKLPLKSDDSFQTAMVDMTQDAQLPAPVAEILNEVVKATKPVSMREKSAAYLATLGVFNWLPKKQQLIDAMNNRSTYAWGLADPPAISPLLASKLGLSRLSGIRTASKYEGGDEYRESVDTNSYGRDRSGGSPRGYGSGGRGRTSPSSYGRDRSAGGYGKSGQSFESSNNRSASSGYGRDRNKSRSGDDRGDTFGQRGRTSRGRSREPWSQIV